MGTIEVIRKFIESNRIIEGVVREATERLPLRFRYGISYGETFRDWLSFLKESEEWDREKLEAYQVEQLRNLLTHAGKNVPYYRRVFREYGFEPHKLRNLDDVRSLPYLDRMSVKAMRPELIAENIPKKKLISVKTSGTTGIPLSLYGTKETEEKHWATIVHLWNRIGYDPRAKTVCFESTAREDGKEPFPWQNYGNRLIISNNHLVDPWVDQLIEMINKFKPEYVIGFPHTIAAFSSYVKKKKRAICESIKGIIVVSEHLYEWQKDLIHDVMGVRLFSDYGMVEKVIHAGGCEHSNAYHFYPQYGLTEYVPLQNDSHELAGTGFVNYAMPLIRYRTGDICRGIRKNCVVCRRQYDTASTIDGRLNDYLVTADGHLVSVHLVLDPRVLAHIERFQLYQEKAGEVELRVWINGKNRGCAYGLLREIQRCTLPLGRGIEYRILTMENQNVNARAKYRMVDQQLDMRSFLH